MTLEKDSKKDHHHHKLPPHHHHHHGTGKPETATTEASHNVIEGHHDNVVTCYGNEEIRALKEELEMESKMRNQAQSRYTELNQQVQDFNFDAETFKNNPESKYDSLITKQNCVNDALSNQVQEARDKLAKLSHSLKNIEICGKDCHLSNKDLCIHYECLSKSELTKEIKRLERMHIDLRSNLDRLQWRLDCEAKNYYHLLDNYQKLQVELYYLEHLSEKYALNNE
ncbi:uncharacterized protein LOC134835642 isoform X2 [Culicoides brevitarsis]|uniref:uncharacterized protein LOC134835642 isoform X2 n=1 Tax=Culicoides brevitarsis TaxID=469753 RepID=UPI00307BF95D